MNSHPHDVNVLSQSVNSRDLGIISGLHKFPSRGSEFNASFEMRNNGTFSPLSYTLDFDETAYFDHTIYTLVKFGSQLPQ